MGRMSLTRDGSILEEARELVGGRTKRETVEIALTELIRRRKREILLQNCGKIEIDIDQNTLRKYREQV